MPLLDHFHPPLSRSHPWRAFHGAWAAAMARLLNDGILTPGFYAVPFLDRTGPLEDEGIVRPWAPAAPELAVAVEWPGVDDARIEVLADEGDPQLDAAVELVSPRNKDRAPSCEAFAAKCADYLWRGCGLVVTDTVTSRRSDLPAELLAKLGVEAPATAAALSAPSYRAVGHDEDGELQVWSKPLDVGQPLPTLPLWLGTQAVVPLDLEARHTAACVDLRVPKT
jgi:hypothetical protein